MRLSLKILFIFSIFILLNPKETEAQKPELIRKWGFFAGAGGLKQIGAFVTPECNCTFWDGGGFDLILGGLFEKEIIYTLRAGVGAGFNLKTFNASFHERELIELISQNTGKTESVPVWFSNQAKASFIYLPIIPYVKYAPADIFFVKTGLNISFLVSSNLKHTKNLSDETATLSTGEIVNISSSGSRAYTLSDTAFSNAKTVLIFFEPSFGFNFKIGDKMWLSPEIQYSLSLTPVTDKDDSFKFSVIRVMAELRFDISPEPK